jgi:ankyrin repeat domain-containing protein 50
MTSIYKPLLHYLPKHLTQPSPPPAATIMYRPDDAHEVYHVAFLLCQVTIPDLIPQILDLAEYWPKTFSCCQDERTYDHFRNAGARYVTARVASQIRPRMVRKVVFSIMSHDQGWCGNVSAGSWTWFEAQVQLSNEQEPSEFTQKELFRNVIADKNYKTHEVTWRYDAEDEEERSLIRSLQTGSVITVHPWARFGGWVNHVSSANVEIYAAVVRKL